MKTHLEREIGRLKRHILQLSAEVERSLKDARLALTKGDLAAAARVIANDADIDQHEVDIEEECLKLMALYQPVAADLRMVICILKMNNDLERMGDLSASIAEFVQEMAKFPPVDVPAKFGLMFDETQRMVHNSLDALVNADPNLAIEVCRYDDVVDDLNVEIISAVSQQIQDNPSSMHSLLFLISASRNVERIADYATNIAEDVYYMAQGKIIRHQAAFKKLLHDQPPSL